MDESRSEAAEADCASRLKILADPTRLQVVRVLLDGPRRVGELNEVIAVEQSLLSHHLRILRDSGLVATERDGKAVVYRLAPDVKARTRGAPGISLGCCRISFDD